MLAQVQFRGFAKKKNSKNPRLLWKWVGGSRSLGIFSFFKSSQNSPKPVLIFWSSIPCVFCLYTLLNFVGYNDLSVLSMLVMVSKKIVWGFGWVELYPIFFGMFVIFLTF